MKTNPNNPINAIVGDSTRFAGLTKREYFAAIAMQGLLPLMTCGLAALTAVKCADLLIIELNKDEK